MLACRDRLLDRWGYRTLWFVVAIELELGRRNLPLLHQENVRKVSIMNGTFQSEDEIMINKRTLLLPANPINKPLHPSLTSLSFSIHNTTSFKSRIVIPLFQGFSGPFRKEAVMTTLFSDKALAIVG